MSGHSKWANIKHKKGKTDAKRGKVFTRISKEITIAAREGGGDPSGNPRLRLAMQNARAVNMPNDNIVKAVKKGTGEIEGVNYEEITYEGYAPNGVAVILETVTDNKKRTVAEFRSLMTKHGGNLGEANSVAWNFERKGVITISTKGKSEDQLMEVVLEAEADDLEYSEDTSRVICPMENFAIVNKYFDEHKYEITEAKLEYIPKQTVNITDVSAAQKILKFIDIFEDHDDVQNLFYNFEIDDSIADQIDND
ncbi:MAG: YebC/PmpR family DNA-binding transcriptional regulator [Ignavibacteria bacterium]|jgi:YebC/PmpR family DNA-binding regulatory protein|nr:YebC/PmpR family DNA-binding transcriptional regulator [Ignavibacteria bacterium]